MSFLISAPDVWYCCFKCDCSIHTLKFSIILCSGNVNITLNGISNITLSWAGLGGNWQILILWAHDLFYLVWTLQQTSKHAVIRQTPAIFKDHLRTNLPWSSRTGPWSQDQDRSDRSWSKTVTALVLTLLQRWK